MEFKQGDPEAGLNELFLRIPIQAIGVGGESAREKCNSPPKRFAVPVSDDDVKVAQASAVPRNTKKCTNWVVNVWADWRANHCKITKSPLELPPHLLVCSARCVDEQVCLGGTTQRWIGNRNLRKQFV